MFVDKEGYVHLIQHLTENLQVFELKGAAGDSNSCVIDFIEQELANQIVALCDQNKALTMNQRNTIIREIDNVVDDLREVLSAILEQEITQAQQEFVVDYAGLIKNLFDAEINALLASS